MLNQPVILLRRVLTLPVILFNLYFNIFLIADDDLDTHAKNYNYVVLFAVIMERKRERNISKYSTYIRCAYPLPVYCSMYNQFKGLRMTVSCTNRFLPSFSSHKRICHYNVCVCVCMCECVCVRARAYVISYSQFACCLVSYNYFLNQLRYLLHLARTMNKILHYQYQ